MLHAALLHRKAKGDNDPSNLSVSHEDERSKTLERALRNLRLFLLSTDAFGIPAGIINQSVSFQFVSKPCYTFITAAHT